MQKKSLILGAAFLGAALGVTHHYTLAQCKVLSAPNTQTESEVPMKNSTPFSCNMAAMTPVQRQRYSVILTQLRAANKEVKELPDGYAFRFDPDPAVLMAAAEFITLESRCCPFFSFALEIQPNGGPIWLRLTGPKEAKPMIWNALAC